MQNNSLSVKYISSLSQYLEIIEKLKSYYPSNAFFNNPVTNSFLYRGHSDKTYKLIPKIFRKHIDFVEEKEAINDTYLSWAKEKDLLYSFIREASGILSIPTDNLSRWAEYAQHYGVPTRFLDWSSNPLVALYFACRDKTETDGSVWLIHAINYRQFLNNKFNAYANLTIQEIINKIYNSDIDFEFPILYTPYYVDSRMSAQGSYFMVWGTCSKPLENMFSSAELKMNLPETDNGSRTFGTAQDKNLLFQFIIYSDRKQPILHEIDTVGINEKTLFPGLDGIGRYVERKYRFDYNEALCNLLVI
jgi:hypothetical protein